MEKVVFVRCELLRGGFPSERTFRVQSHGGIALRGTAPAQYCYTLDHKPIGNEPPPRQPMDGLLAGLQIAQIGSEAARVYLPDGQIYDLPTQMLIPVPKGGVEYVPVGT